MRIEENVPMSERSQPLDAERAHAVYDVLMQEVGASEHWRENFIAVESREHVSEFRFQGALGFGGKFWRTVGRDPVTDEWGELWLVNCYPEDHTPERQAMIDRANDRLRDLRVGLR